MPEPGELDTPLLRASEEPPAAPGPQNPAEPPGPSTWPSVPPPASPPPTAPGGHVPPGPPLPPSTFGQPSWPPPAPPPQSPSTWRRSVAAIAVVLMLLAGGALVGSSARGGSLFSNDSSSSASNNGRVFRPSGAGSFTPPSDQGNVSGVASNVAPALVNIVTTIDGGGEGAGTGMVISSSGEVLTNNHVIENADSINVEIGGDGSSHSAKVIGYDVRDDVALLKIDGVSGLDTIPVGQPDSASVNDPVVVMGNALGQGGAPAVASGTITAVDQQITATDSDGSNAETLTNLIRVEADVQPGDSGGALVDGNGKVIGMTTAASTGGFRFREEASGVGFAIRIDNALSIVKQIRNGDETDGVHVGARALLGVSLQDPSASRFGGRGTSSGASTSGAVVLNVASNTPADDAGIQAGDTIVSIGNSSVSSTNELEDVMNTYHPDDKVKVTWTDSSGDNHSATVKLIEGPPA